MGGGDLAGASGEANPRRRGCGILIHPSLTAKRFGGGAPLFRRGRWNSARGKKTTKGGGEWACDGGQSAGLAASWASWPSGGVLSFFLLVLFCFTFLIFFCFG